MDDEPTVQLKRANDQSTTNRDGPPSKRRNTGNVLDLRRRNRGNAYVTPTGGTLTDPLNLNSASQSNVPTNTNERKRRFDDAAGAVYQRRMSFRQPKKRVEHVPTVSGESTSSLEARKSKQVMLNRRYRYGNFNYHHKTSSPFMNDPRIDLLVEDWFRDQNVLDIGCNSGLLTLSIARTFSPHRILGIDIDEHLIGAARKNIRHFQDKDQKVIGKFPASFSLNYGPISVLPPSTSPDFPNNVWFRQENYVFESDDELQNVKEEFDIILAFSLTKWIHLNFGDAGLMRFFKRVYRQLKPGGRFVFEPQSSRGYRKRSTMVSEMEANYKSIKMWPDTFAQFLLSIGFVHYEALDTPLVRSLDCDTPIYMFYKGPMIGWNAPEYSVPEAQEQHPIVAEFNNVNYTGTPRADGSQCASTPGDDSKSTPNTPGR